MKSIDLNAVLTLGPTLSPTNIAPATDCICKDHGAKPAYKDHGTELATRVVQLTYEIKGDVGMSCNEKEGEQNNA